jgi:arylsulfatase A-like enzyme
MNVVLICLDTYRADCLAAAGRNTIIQTPCMDALAGDGIRFDNAFGEAQPTIEFRRTLCTGMRAFPWRYAYDTRGLWPNGRGWHKIPPEQDTLAEILLDQGYTTGLFADTYHMFKPTQNFTRGFTSWESVRGQESDNYRSGPLDAVDVSRYQPPGSAREAVPPVLMQYLLNMQDRRREEDWTSAQAFLGGMRFLEDNRDNQPFLLWVDSFDPHEPWDPPTRYADVYAPDWDAGWEPIFQYAGDDERVRQRVQALYYGECTFVDRWIGHLLEKLEELKLADETLVIVTSDHGTELWDHGAVGKGSHECRYRHNSEILWLMRVPGGQHRNLRVPGLVQNTDIVPTILALLGQDREDLDGQDVMPLVRGEKDALRECTITGWGSRASVRTPEWAWSCDYESEDPDQRLFYLPDDPGENSDVAASNAATCSRFRHALEEHLGQQLPARPMDTIHQTEAPIRRWWQRAPQVRRWRDGG